MPMRWHICGSRGPWGLKQDPRDQQESRPQSKGMLRPGQNLEPSRASGPGIHAGSPAPGCTHRQAGTGEEGSRADHLQIWGSGWLLQPGGDSAGQGDYWPGEAAVLHCREKNTSDAEWTAQLLILSSRALQLQSVCYQFLGSMPPSNNLLFQELLALEPGTQS